LLFKREKGHEKPPTKPWKCMLPSFLRPLVCATPLTEGGSIEHAVFEHSGKIAKGLSHSLWWPPLNEKNSEIRFVLLMVPGPFRL
jgi:hypothetical protein